MEAKKHLRFTEESISPGEKFRNVIADLLKPEHQIEPYCTSENWAVFNKDCLEVLSCIGENSVDMIFADPPYMLSNNGITCQNGRMVNVNKGKWDKSKGFEEDIKFHDA